MPTGFTSAFPQIFYYLTLILKVQESRNPFAAPALQSKLVRKIIYPPVIPQLFRPGFRTLSMLSFFGLSFTLLAGELFARYCLGLGSPPLFVPDPLTEYRLRPNQALRRFGNRIEVNAQSMRAAPLSPTRSAEARRVLVFGDSVVWGGAVLDQTLIATDRLRNRDREVGNVAAPSWGPGNWLGWARRFGFLQATDVVVVISSHDAYDNPSPHSFTGDTNHPLQPPFSALFEGLERYTLPRLGIRFSASASSSSDSSAEPTSSADPSVQRALADLHAFLKLARATGARVAVVQFADRLEATNGTLQPGNAWINQVLQKEGVPSLQAAPIFRSCGPIANLYIDSIHPYTPAGQACLAKAIEHALMLP